jgi:hypothetical protein
VELRSPSTRSSTKVCSRNISTHIRVRLWEDIPEASGSLLVYNTLCSSKPLDRSSKRCPTLHIGIRHDFEHHFEAAYFFASTLFHIYLSNWSPTLLNHPPPLPIICPIPLHKTLRTTPPLALPPNFSMQHTRHQHRAARKQYAQHGYEEHHGEFKRCEGSGEVE